MINHKLRIARDTVKNPLKGLFLGGPTLEEALETLKQEKIKKHENRNRK